MKLKKNLYYKITHTHKLFAYNKLLLEMPIRKKNCLYSEMFIVVSIIKNIILQFLLFINVFILNDEKKIQLNFHHTTPLIKLWVII